jgi:hypothetical protein
MTVQTFAQPDFTAQDNATYKANIDHAIAVLAEAAKQFAPREMAVPAMGITIEQGHLPDGTSIAATNVTGIGAPGANPRIDRIYYSPDQASYQRVVGTEASSPVAPALPGGAVPIAQIMLTVGQTAILNANIVDERVHVSAFNFLRLAAFNFIELIDTLGNARILVGKPGVDHRIIVRHHQTDGSSKLEGQQSDGTIKWWITDKGTFVGGTFTVATLPAAAAGLKNAHAFVTDGSVVAAGNFGTVVAGGGANNVPVYCDGTNWRIG